MYNILMEYWCVLMRLLMRLLSVTLGQAKQAILRFRKKSVDSRQETGCIGQISFQVAVKLF